MNAAAFIDPLNHWEQLPAGSLQEKAYFCDRVKPSIPDLKMLVLDQDALIAQLSRELQAARAEAAEYKTRAESQTKTNETLRQTNCEVSAENLRLRNVMKQAAAILFAANT